jgi:hypothetical protein
MKRPSGKRWFYSLGQRSANRGEYTGPWPNDSWPFWARSAFYSGHEDGRWSNALQTVKTWPISKLAEAA